MNGRSLDENHDLHLKGSAVARNTSFADVVAQRVETMLKTYAGECYVNRFHGIPWYSEILGESVLDIGYAKATLKDRIMGVPGVKEVVSIELAATRRVLSGSVRFRCTDGAEAKGTF